MWRAAGRRGTGNLRVVHARPLDDITIERVTLPPGYAGQLVSVRGRLYVQVAEAVPESRHDPTARHLLSGHGSAALADALGILVCETGTCEFAAVWLDRDRQTRAAGGSP